MKISDRFTDYGLIGGLFWMMQALLLWLVLPGSTSLPMELIEKNICKIPPGALSVLTALLGALAVVAIFTTGLLLDLFGSFYLLLYEMTAFHALAKTNESWLRRLLEKHPDYVQSDWALLLRVPSSKQQWIAVLKVFVFWNARYRKEFVETLRANLVPRGSYVRLQAFLFSYVFLHSGTEKIELLTNQISLWNTSRTIAAVMAFCAVEAPLLWMFSERQFLLSRVFPFPYLLLQVLFTAAAFAITTAAFRRVCSTLLALAYLIDHKANESASAAE